MRINPEDTSEARAIARRFGVRGYPTLLLVTDAGESVHISSHVRRGGAGLTADPAGFNRDCLAAL